MKQQDYYQYALLGFTALVVIGVGIFTYHELFPEYKTYQETYEKLEEFRSSYTHEDPAPFSKGIKQIVIPKQGCGPESIDRCISCHVAIDLPHFSATRPAHDVNGKLILDANGNPELEPNPEYIWSRLEDKITLLRHPDIQNERLARQLEELKKGEKVLQMHPLLPGETRPFEFHPMSEYGCTTCHGGNGRSLVAERAHGPVYDGSYHPSYSDHKPQFTEIDPEHDPKFAQMYNNKPGHDLIFQTTPLLAGPLIVANCVQCHESSQAKIESTLNKFSYIADEKKQQLESVRKGIKNDENALKTLMSLQKLVEKSGREDALDILSTRLATETLSSEERSCLEGQRKYLLEHEEALFEIQTDIEKTQERLKGQNNYQTGQEIVKRFSQAEEPVKWIANTPEIAKGMETNVDRQIAGYERGKALFISQACYACHKIGGYTRASVGPELTKAGNSYPWYIKESIVWPQADLPSSTMPNFRLDHEELADLMTFLMAQKGDRKAISEVDYHIALANWEKGAKMPWEKPVAPNNIDQVRVGQLVFASEGCAACHKLKGFETNAAFKNHAQDLEWFQTKFPEQIPGSKLVQSITENQEAIDTRIVYDENRNGIIEEIERLHPGLVEGFYTNFKFAQRALSIEDQERLKKVLAIYIQEYGLGRDIAPHLNFSGIYRSDEWLFGHFKNPPAYTAKSIMPVMPFDDSKFYMLNHMLHALAVKNRDAIRELWKDNGFNPPLAYQMLCSSCHGEQRQGNGIVSEWIYPIPKNLRNPEFLKSLTRERAIESISCGVLGTPMAPWSASVVDDKIPVLKEDEVEQLVDWLYQGISYDPRVQKDSEEEKWLYTAKDAVKEMGQEKSYLQPSSPSKNVQDYFEVKVNPNASPDKELYYIREKFYTQNNLDAARDYFMVNCASCHGSDGAGTGLRATSMVEAKPRMLTNLPWLKQRDDLRLLRSIKYGIPGTAMVAWGDQTTSEQRMQLVMYIRDLTHTTLLRSELNELLYAAFDCTIQLIEKARSTHYGTLVQLTQELVNKREELFGMTEDSHSKEDAIGALYAQIVNLEKKYDQLKSHDTVYQELMESIKSEKTIYESLGSQLIANHVDDFVVQLALDLIKHHPLQYTVQDGSLRVKEVNSEKIKTLESSLIAYFDVHIQALNTQLSCEKGKMLCKETEAHMQDLSTELATYTQLRGKVITLLADAAAERNHQKNLLPKQKTG